MDLNRETALRPASSPTAFLESPRIDRITAEIKQVIVDTYAKCGNLSVACTNNGVSPRMMRLHYNQDAAFKQAIDEAREQISDKAEGHIVEHMSRPSNVVDRLAWLRAWRPERWNPQQNVAITVDGKQVERLVGDARQFIDTTATPTTDKPT